MTGTAMFTLRVPKRSELIAEAIRREIVRGALAEHDCLPSESELVERFGVSRPTVREAFRILESEGLIELRQGARGARIRRPTERATSRSVGLLLQFRGTTLADIWDARLVLEPPLAGRLAKTQRPSDLAMLRKSIEEHRNSASNTEAFAAATADFHSRVITLAGNRTLSVLANVLNEVFRLHASEVVPHRSSNDDQDGRDATQQHEELVRLIEAGDSDEVETFWRRHLEAGATAIVEEHGAATVLELFGDVDSMGRVTACQ